jgi:heme-degrading monooxygenase HmoA
MIVVVSQAWTLDAEGHADAYIALSREFLAFMRQHPGFKGRRLLRGAEDRTHFTNLRLFDDLPSYEELTRFPGYNDHIQKMGAHLKPYTTYPREFMEVVLDDEELA